MNNTNWCWDVLKEKDTQKFCIIFIYSWQKRRKKLFFTLLFIVPNKWKQIETATFCDLIENSFSYQIHFSSFTFFVGRLLLSAPWNLLQTTKFLLMKFRFLLSFQVEVSLLYSNGKLFKGTFVLCHCIAKSLIH